MTNIIEFINNKFFDSSIFQVKFNEMTLTNEITIFYTIFSTKK